MHWWWQCTSALTSVEMRHCFSPQISGANSYNHFALIHLHRCALDKSVVDGYPVVVCWKMLFDATAYQINRMATSAYIFSSPDGIISLYFTKITFFVTSYTVCRLCRNNRFTALLEYVRDHPSEQVPGTFCILCLLWVPAPQPRRHCLVAVVSAGRRLPADDWWQCRGALQLHKLPWWPREVRAAVAGWRGRRCKTGCDGMGIGHVLRKEGMIRWRNVWSMKRPRGRPKKTWRETVVKDCQACKLNREDAMDRTRWRKQIRDDWWPW